MDGRQKDVTDTCPAKAPGSATPPESFLLRAGEDGADLNSLRHPAQAFEHLTEQLARSRILFNPSRFPF
jgi:hypothetical protein